MKQYEKKEKDLFCYDGDRECCFRKGTMCQALINTQFDDECHFRKVKPDGNNIYDLKRGKVKGKQKLAKKTKIVKEKGLAVTWIRRVAE